MPLYFAGRKDQLGMIDGVLDRAKSAYKPKKDAKVSVGPMIVLTGPRGIGKTLLLTKASKMAIKKKIQCVEMTEAEISSNPAGLLFALFPDGKLEGFLKRQEQKMKGKKPGAFDIEAPTHTGLVPRLIHEAYTERLKSGPLLITVDEAHAIDEESLRDFCSQALAFMRRNQPLCVIFAGTPSIRRLVRKNGPIHAQWTKVNQFNLLSDAEARDAFAKNLLAVDMSVEPKALEKLAKWSGNYPYFVQKAGFRTWHCIESFSNKHTITEADVDKGLEKATKDRASFFEGRVDELNDESLFDEALLVVKLFRNAKGVMSAAAFKKEMMGTIKELDRSSMLAMERNFVELGFLYKQGTKLSPGIPSLFKYLERYEEYAKW